MNRWWWVLCMPLVAFAKTTVTVTPREIAFGQPVEMRIIGRELATFDLSPFRRDFMPEVISRQHSNGRDTLVLRLYARHVGRLNLPTMVVDGKPSRPISVIVDPDPDMKVVSGIERTTAWIREPLTAWIDVFSRRRDPLADVDEVESTTWHLRRLTDEQREVNGADGTWYVRRLQWEALPLRDGDLALALPPVLLGGSRKVPVPVLSAHVRPLPGYVPAWVPVGKVALKSGALPAEVAVEKPFAREWIARGRGLDASALRPAIEEAERTASLRYYPPEISEESGPDPSSRQFRIRLTAVPLITGPLVLPPVPVPYVDQDGKVRIAESPSAVVEAYSPALRNVRRAALALLATVTFAALLYAVRGIVGRAVMRLRAIYSLSRAPSPAALRNALLRWPSTSPARPRTVRRWLAGVRRPNAVLVECAETLERIRWGRRHGDLGHLRKRLLRALVR